jgi:CBS domain-containing protein
MHFPASRLEEAMPQRPIRDVIANKKPPLLLAAATTVHEAAKRMKRQGVGAAMIVDGERLVGIFTERDALQRVLAEGRDAKTTKVADVMTAEPRTISADRPIGLALLMMFEGGFRHVPVVDRGRPVGMVSARDALGPELREFEHELERRDQISRSL